MCHLVLSVNQRPLDLIRAKEHLDVMRATWVFASLLFGAATFVHLNPSFSEEAIESFVDSALSQDQDEADLWSALPLQVKDTWPVIMVDFVDATAPSQFKERVDRLLASAEDYLDEASNGAIEVSFMLHPSVVRAPSSVSAYGQNSMGMRDVGAGDDRGPAELVEEVLGLIGSEVNWSGSDLDADGTVDRLLIVHASKGEESSGRSSDIWSHYGPLESPYSLPDDMSIDSYVLASGGLTGLENLGTMVHEMLHMAGAIDLYDVHGMHDGSDWSGVGVFDIMASGNWNDRGRTPSLPTSATLSLVGQERYWRLDPLAPANSQVLISPWSEGGDAIQIRLSDREYVHLEHRSQTGFDSALPGSGLLVLQRDDLIIGLEDNGGNLDPDYSFLRVVEADGDRGLERGVDEGKVSDLFTEGDVFGAEGISIHDRRGFLVPWVIEVLSSNSTGTLIHINTSLSSPVVLDGSTTPIGLIPGESVGIDVLQNNACSTDSDLSVNIQTNGVSNEFSTVTTSTGWRLLMPTDDLISAGTSVETHLEIRCQNYPSRRASLDLVGLSWRPLPVTESIVFHAVSTVPSSSTITVPGDGVGSQLYHIQVLGALARVTDPNDSLIIESSSNESGDIVLEIVPDGLLTPNMIADGTLLLEHGGARYEISVRLETERPVESVSSTFGLPETNAGRLSLMLLLMGFWVLLAGMRPRTNEETDAGMMTDTFEGIDESVQTQFHSGEDYAGHA